jgi:hypothetical protein
VPNVRDIPFEQDLQLAASLPFVPNLAFVQHWAFVPSETEAGANGDTARCLSLDFARDERVGDGSRTEKFKRALPAMC